MKRFVLAFLTCFAFSATITAQTKDSVYFENKVNGIWQKSQLEIITRNDACSILSDLQLSWNESSQSWVNSFLSTYDSTSTGITLLTQSWDALNNIWINSSRSLIFGSASQKVYQYQIWDAASESWINNFRGVDNFDDEGRDILSEADLYSNNQWQKLQRSLFAYDADNRITESIFQMWMNNAWVNNGKTTYDYNSGTMLDYLWSVGDKQWTRFRRTLNNYIDNTTLITKSYGQLYSGSAWQNNERSQNTYNDNNQMLSEFQQFWDATMQAWANSSKLNMDYYKDGNSKHFEFEGWDETSNSWSYGSRSTYTDLSCGATLQIIPVNQMKTNTGMIVQNGKTNFIHRLPATQPNAKNTIKRIFNPFAGDRNTLVYDLTVNNDQSHQYELVLSSAQRPQKINNQVKSNMIATNNTGFILSPNPAKNYFDINLSAYKNAGNITLKLSDISGKAVLQQKMNAGMQRIYLPTLQKGVYIVTIISDNNIQNQKLVIE